MRWSKEVKHTHAHTQLIAWLHRNLDHYNCELIVRQNWMEILGTIIITSFVLFRPFFRNHFLSGWKNMAFGHKTLFSYCSIFQCRFAVVLPFSRLFEVRESNFNDCIWTFGREGKSEQKVEESAKYKRCTSSLRDKYWANFHNTIYLYVEYCAIRYAKDIQFWYQPHNTNKSNRLLSIHVLHTHTQYNKSGGCNKFSTAPAIDNSFMDRCTVHTPYRVYRMAKFSSHIFDWNNTDGHIFHTQMLSTTTTSIITTTMRCDEFVFYWI